MNIHLQRLFNIAGKSNRKILGLMSGTSVDGLDLALCDISGFGYDTKAKVMHFSSIPYTDDEKSALLYLSQSEQLNPEILCIRHTWFGNLIADKINKTLKDWNVNYSDVDLIASHGQTIRHAPRRKHGISNMPNSTLQIGDGDVIATGTDIITISDFRMRHIAAGGEGAPLAGFGDDILFSTLSNTPVILLNIGGISNITWVNGRRDGSEPISFDTGPGNTLLDSICRTYLNQAYDENGAVAASGVPHAELLKRLTNHPFFKQKPPKTTGSEMFNLSWIQEMWNGKIEPNDLLATLVLLTVHGIVKGLEQNVRVPDGTPLLVSGGGVHNKTLMQHLIHALPKFNVQPTTSYGIDPDAKEALIFAILANELVCGKGFRVGHKTINFGKISFPAQPV